MKRFTVRLSDKEHEDLEKLSLDLERSINDMVREAVRLYVARYSTD